MTREEAISLIIKVFDALEGECNIEYDWSKEHNARDMAIKALEQEPILDKIRAEIWDLQYGDEEKNMTDEDRADAYNNAIIQAIEIIDKCRAEMESE